MVFLLLLLSAGCAARQPDGQPSASSLAIENKGSDTMVNLAMAWAERYQQIHPEARISVTGGGSGTGLAALANGTVDLANASRAIKPEEVALIEAQGAEPHEHVVAGDAIAVIVHPANPIERLTLAQIASIFKGEINNWSELGGADRPIVRLSRETNSGTHVYFLETVIRLGSSEDKSIFSPTTLLLPSSEGIIAEVADNPNAIGYDGLGYITPHVKVLSIAKEEGANYVFPSLKTVADGSYPIARDLYIYTRGQPSQAAALYLDWILSPEAQEIVAELGFVPYAP